MDLTANWLRLERGVVRGKSPRSCQGVVILFGFGLVQENFFAYLYGS